MQFSAFHFERAKNATGYVIETCKEHDLNRTQCGFFLEIG